MVLNTPCPVSRLPGFADGDVSVQDAAAQLAAPLLLAGTMLPPEARATAVRGVPLRADSRAVAAAMASLLGR